MKNKTYLIGSLLLPLLAANHACATDGYFAHAYSVKAQGLGGVAIALPQDGLAAAANPAGTALVGNRIDAGLTWFDPQRGARITGSGAPGANGDYDGNDSANFFIPEFGYTRQLSPTTAVGLALYGNGGMNTNYGNNPYAAFGSKGRAGVDLAQVFISPSLAYRIDERHTIGAAVNFAYQRFSASGLGAFAGSSADAASLSDRGRDSSTGLGLRLGWSGRLTPDLTLGATWASKITTGGFDKYRGLFADGGSFDIPLNYGLGLAFKAAPGLTLAADVVRIEYSGVKSVGNPLANLFAGNALGTANGPGFGWRDVTAFKAGASYDYSRELTLRAGYNHSGQPIAADQTLFNILAPGVVQNHLSLGASWKTSGGEWSLAYTRALKKTVNGTNSIPSAFGGGNANVSLSENIVGLAYSLAL